MVINKNNIKSQVDLKNILGIQAKEIDQTLKLNKEKRIQ